MDIVLIFLFFISLFLALGSFLVSGLDCNEEPTYRARLRLCLVCSTIIMAGSFATLPVMWNDDSEYVKSVETSLKNCMERFPEYQDRCVIPVRREL